MKYVTLNIIYATRLKFLFDTFAVKLNVALKWNQRSIAIATIHSYFS
jgi:hypothetical protein